MSDDDEPADAFDWIERIGRVLGGQQRRGPVEPGTYVVVYACGNRVQLPNSGDPSGVCPRCGVASITTTRRVA